MRGVSFSQGEFYHIYNRGVDKRTIFSSHTEYERFIDYLSTLNNVRTDLAKGHPLRNLSVEAKPRQERQQQLVAIGAYCLMPNHFHLYLTPLHDDGISRFMHRLQTAYTMYFNKAHERTGSLFQGTFKARHVDSDVYARYILSYIHLNPAKLAHPDWKQLDREGLSRIAPFVESYPYSSIGEYMSGAHAVTDPSPFPEYLASLRDVRSHIHDWLESATAGVEA